MLHMPAIEPPAPREGPFGQLIIHRAPGRTGTAALRSSIQALSQGECVAFAIRLTGPAADRLRAAVTFRSRRRAVEHTMRQEGAEIVARLGVDPDLDAPGCVYELGTAAGRYADRHLRPRGRARATRRLFARLFGCDPALGAVVIVCRKS